MMKPSERVWMTRRCHLIPLLILTLLLFPACTATSPRSLNGSSAELEEAVSMAESEYVMELLSKPSEELTEKEIAYLAMMAERQQAAEERRQTGILETMLMINIGAVVAGLVLVLSPVVE